MDQRIIIPMPNDLVAAIDKWRYANEVPSRAEAVRILIETGLGKTPEKKRTSEPAGESRTHFYKNVIRLGNVAVSRHAQAQMIEGGITQAEFDRALLTPTKPDVPDGADILWRERDGIRIVILTNPTPNVGAKLVKTVFRIERQAQARTSR